ncbi:MAG: hypothetical protein H6674_09305 [Dehalococcoidia bacterium]|nr:hypothetical protein [Dehalococcoidia bacterium]
MTFGEPRISNVPTSIGHHYGARTLSPEFRIKIVNPPPTAQDDPRRSLLQEQAVADVNGLVANFVRAEQRLVVAPGSTIDLDRAKGARKSAERLLARALLRAFWIFDVPIQPFTARTGAKVFLKFQVKHVSISSGREDEADAWLQANRLPPRRALTTFFQSLCKKGLEPPDELFDVRYELHARLGKATKKRS